MAEKRGLDGAARAVLATDLEVLAALHDHELDAARIRQLADAAPRAWLGLDLVSEGAARGFDRLQGSLPCPNGVVAPDVIDDLAADYAEIYLNYGYHASPYESVWLDTDHLERQGPMFAVREWYRHYGLAAEDWSARPEDHIALQLSFLSHLLGRGEPHATADAARFMDRHILLWIDDFAETVAARCRTPFYGGLALVTAAYLQELRDLLAVALDLPREVVEGGQADGKANGQGNEEEEGAPRYFPGAGPGW